RRPGTAAGAPAGTGNSPPMTGPQPSPDAAASPSSVTRAALTGLAAAVPLLMGVIPFGLAVGALAVEAGLTPLEGVAMSVLVFAGAGQTAALGLLAAGAPAWVAVAGSIVVNLRFVMYSAAIAPIFRPLPAGLKLLYAYVLTDQAFVMAVDHYRRQGRPLLQGAYYAGLSAAIWVAWVAATAAGGLFGARLPGGGWLDFVTPLIFLSLLVPALRDRPAAAAAVTSAVVALLGHRLPLNLGMLAAALAGIAAGLAVGRRGDA
ncbi:MAG: AzlC family ABC transporter permease, partial [Thermaerobacter sp.]